MNTKILFYYHLIKPKLKKILSKIIIKYLPFEYAKLYYKQRTGKKLDYKNPLDLNEKLFWLQRYWQHPLVTMCSDKLQVRKFVTDKGYSACLNELYGFFSNAEEINFDSLPNQFVLKCTHGCGYNIFCTDKRIFDITLAKKMLTSWINTTYGKETAEFHYSRIKPMIICEKFLQSTNHSLAEYQIFCINGEPQFFLARNDLGLHGEITSAESYTLDWKRVELRNNESAEKSIIKKPFNYQLMIEASKNLSKPFPHVRVDFYEIDNKLVFGEMTFSTSGNVLSNYKYEIVVDMGLKLTLPMPISH